MSGYFTKKVAFIGFMGSGKSSLARRLARKLQSSSADVDAFIIRESGLEIDELFSEFGENVFRDWETHALQKILLTDIQFIACGGGIVDRQENIDLLKENCYIIYLKASPENSYERVSNLQSRPLLADKQAASLLFDNRMPIYEKVADAIISIDNKQLSNIIFDVIVQMKRQGVLCQMQE